MIASVDREFPNRETFPPRCHPPFSPQAPAYPLPPSELRNVLSCYKAILQVKLRPGGIYLKVKTADNLRQEYFKVIYVKMRILISSLFQNGLSSRIGLCWQTIPC
jgi:hypothetical protein